VFQAWIICLDFSHQSDRNHMHSESGNVIFSWHWIFCYVCWFVLLVQSGRIQQTQRMLMADWSQQQACQDLCKINCALAVIAGVCLCYGMTVVNTPWPECNNCICRNVFGSQKPPFFTSVITFGKWNCFTKSVCVSRHNLQLFLLQHFVALLLQRSSPLVSCIVSQQY
jgi:hypothetical protein